MRDKLRVLIRAKNLTLSQIAKHSGVNISRISQYLSDKSDLRGDSLCRLLKQLEIDVEHLVSKKIHSTLEHRDESQLDIYESLHLVLKRLPAIESKTILETIISKAKLHEIDRGSDVVEKLISLKSQGF